MRTILNALMLTVVAGVLATTEDTAHAGLCISPPYQGNWQITGNGPTYSQFTALRGLRFDFRCVDDSNYECSDEGGEEVCTSTSGVRSIETASIRLEELHLGEPPSRYWSNDLDVQVGSDGWKYVDTSIAFIATRVWFRPIDEKTLQVVSDTVQAGSHKYDWVTMTRPPVLRFPRLPV